MLEPRQRQVTPDAENLHEALNAPIFRDERYSRRDAMGRRRDPASLAVDADLARVRACEAEQGLAESRSPGADQAIDSNHLAATDRETHVGEIWVLGERTDLKERSTFDGLVLTGEELGERPSHHLTHEFRLGPLPDRTGAQLSSVPHDRDAIGESEDLRAACGRCRGSRRPSPWRSGQHGIGRRSLVESATKSARQE